MKPEQQSQKLLGVTRAKAKMLEYGIPEESHMRMPQDPLALLTLAVGMLGDVAAEINASNNESDAIENLKKHLVFSAYFFDSYIETKLNTILDPYLCLLGSASYYLCDLPGSAFVLAKRLNIDNLDLDSDGLEKLLLWLLQSDYSHILGTQSTYFSEYIQNIYLEVQQFFEKGIGENRILDWSTKLRAFVYDSGTPRQLLLGDIIAAILRKKIQNSSWIALPLYSGISQDKWKAALQKQTFIQELWPAQHLLGQKGVLKGESAVVQMPTSAGKTKAVELILRSAFLAGRASLCVIVAPFRSLCHEIKDTLRESFAQESIQVDELSDVFQTDFDINSFLVDQQILVLTPEKLFYVLRHSPELTDSINLIIFDEGHQFDNGSRGITYELLLTSLRFMLPEATQKVLISAVISNAEIIGQWMNGESHVVKGTNLITTFRSIGFASWIDSLGKIQYVDSQNPEKEEFFVPRVIEPITLNRKKGERNARLFPGKDHLSVALYLGLKLVPNGGIAIFCGQKQTAVKICRQAVDIYERNISFPPPREFSNQDEIDRLVYLHGLNLGEDAPTTQSAKFGFFSHHGNMPQGIRLAVEYSMRENLIRFVICTSTLAQGVNLPIRYLIVTTSQQGQESIKVRDFHNLIGRAGRAGMHTEGSIIFSNTNLYDQRNRETWRWNQTKQLLDSNKSEECISTLLSVFDPIKNDRNTLFLKMDALDFVKRYIHTPGQLPQWIEDVASSLQNQGFSKDGITRQISWKINLISAVESFLLSHWDEAEQGLPEMDVIRLAEGTLAFALADNQTRDHICELFTLLADNIANNISDPTCRKIYGRTLYGTQDIQDIETWFRANINDFLSITSDNEILDLVWPLFTERITHGIFNKFDQPEERKEIVNKWLNGESFANLLNTIRQKQIKILKGSKKGDFNIGHMVELCEGTLAYDGALLIGALCELLTLVPQNESSKLLSHLQFFQKRLKYGLPTVACTVIYELGLADRHIVQDLVTTFDIETTQRAEVMRILRQNNSQVLELMDKYPCYFKKKIESLLSS